MKSFGLFVRPALLVLLVLTLVSPKALARTGDFGLPGESSGSQTPDSGPLTVITDSGDIFGIRYGSKPHKSRIVLWSGSGPLTEVGDSPDPILGIRYGGMMPGSRHRALPIVIVVDPVTGAVVGVEPVGPAGEGAWVGSAHSSEDGYVRIVLPIRSARHR